MTEADRLHMDDLADLPEDLREEIRSRRGDVFICVICERLSGDKHFYRTGRERAVYPVCPSCEGGMGKYHGYGTRRSIPRIGHGAFMDRRLAHQVGALAEALEVEAHQKNWSAQHGRP